MNSVRHTIFLLLVALSLASFGQIGFNSRPQIIGQFPLSTNENQPITILLSNLIVVDLNDVYPIGFTLKLYDGKNYSIEGSTVTPDKNYKGTLTVEVTVNDGKEDSRKFDLKIQVKEVDNIEPIITGQEVLSVTAGGQITLSLSNLTVEDPDNEYPEDFTLKVSSGENYERNGLVVTPDPGFVGTLTVPVAVDDGEDESDKFNLKIEVTELPNIPPSITGQEELFTNEDQNITLQLNHLKVEDPDNDYPKDFTLIIAPGSPETNYTVSGNKITPSLNFTGVLLVSVTVRDSKDESSPFLLKITVRPVNDAPVITAQKALTTFVNNPITIQLTDLTVSDPDNLYPDDFSLKISNGPNYRVDGNIITPVVNFTGILNANITVEDGTATSPVYTLEIRVIAQPNVAPVITGQNPLPVVVTENNMLTILFSNLIVNDSDNSYPKDFTLTVQSGANYTVSGTSITPSPNFTGSLTVKVSVNDGTVNSNIFNLQVQVIPVSSNPQIIGQEVLIINEDDPISIRLSDLIVSDADNNYPEGFTLQVLPGKDYTVNKNTVTPALNLNGFLVVEVTVTDPQQHISNSFSLALLISPVNDAPEITQFETTDLSYEPGTNPIGLTALFEVEDVDNDHLSFAEVSIGIENYSKGHDELLFTDALNIQGFFDVDAGKLSLIGYATLQEYQEAVRSITYNYKLSVDEGGVIPEIAPGTKTILLNVHDGQHPSPIRVRNINMETTVTLDIPTAFTPNGDGPNELWNIHALANAHQMDEAIIRVYNKRGLLLFQSVGLDKKWDGTYKGEVLPTDTYYYTIDLKLSYAKKTYKGVVTLLR